MYKKFLILFLFSNILNGQVNTESLRTENKNTGFKNQFNLELGYEKANSTVLDLEAEYRLDYTKENNYHSFIIINLEKGYKKENNSPKSIISNKGFAHLRTTKNLFKNYQIELFTQYEFNDFLLLNDRQLIGSVVRIGIQKNNIVNFHIGIGFMYEKETYNLNFENQENLLRSTNYFKNNIVISPNIDLSNTCYLQIASVDINDYRILYDGEFNFKVNDFFAFNIELNYRYDNDPNGNLENSYIQISNGVSFNF